MKYMELNQPNVKVNPKNALTFSLLAACQSALISGLWFTPHAQSAELNTALPTEQSDQQKLAVDLPKQPLAISLKQFARDTGVSLSFDNKLVDGKTAPALKGHMSRKEALQTLLSGSGLSAEIDGDSAIVKKLPEDLPLNKELSTVEVRAKRFYEIGPLPGLGLTKEQIPGNVQSITAKEIKNLTR